MPRSRRPFTILSLFLVFAFACFSAGISYGQMGAIAAVDEPEPAAGGGSAVAGKAGAGTGASAASRSNRSAQTRSRSSKTTSTASKTSSAAKTPKPPAKYDGFVVGDKYTFLNFEVVSAEKPYHTRAAKASGAKGLVQVELLIDVDGSVLTAKGRTGNKELWPEAERAALASKFNRPTFGGKPARAIGFLVYRFGPAED